MPEEALFDVRQVDAPQEPQALPVGVPQVGHHLVAAREKRRAAVPPHMHRRLEAPGDPSTVQVVVVGPEQVVDARRLADRVGAEVPVQLVYHREQVGIGREAVA